MAGYITVNYRQYLSEVAVGGLDSASTAVVRPRVFSGGSTGAWEPRPTSGGGLSRYTDYDGDLVDIDKSIGKIVIPGRNLVDQEATGGDTGTPGIVGYDEGVREYAIFGQLSQLLSGSVTSPPDPNEFKAFTTETLARVPITGNRYGAIYRCNIQTGDFVGDNFNNIGLWDTDWLSNAGTTQIGTLDPVAKADPTPGAIVGIDDSDTTKHPFILLGLVTFPTIANKPSTFEIDFDISINV